MNAPKRREGVVLFIVLFFTLLLTASIATFSKRAVVDAILSRNREAMVRTEALARGGIALAQAVLIQDRLADTAPPTGVGGLGGAGAPDAPGAAGGAGAAGGGGRLDSNLDVWAQAGGIPIDAGDGATLRLTIEDSGALFNLNALFQPGAQAQTSERSKLFLFEFLKKIVEEFPPELKALYDDSRLRELAENLIDYVDADDTRIGGGFEDDYYQKQIPPYRAANRPLLSVEEIGLIEGFDSQLVAKIRPYITVHPLVKGRGINPNTAPPHILSLIYYNDGVEYRLVKEDDVRRILETRESGAIFCEGQERPECTSLSDILPNSASIHPPLAYFSDVFTVHSEAEFANVKRSVEAVVDRSQPSQPLLLSWKVR